MLIIMSYNSSNNVKSWNSNNFEQSAPYETAETGSNLTNGSASKLEPTAQEFYPSSSSLNRNQGAVKKRYQGQGNRWNGRNQRYGSGRTFNSNNYDSDGYKQSSFLSYSEKSKDPRYSTNSFSQNTSTEGKACVTYAPDSNTYEAEVEIPSRRDYGKNMSQKKYDNNVNIYSNQYTEHDNRYNTYRGNYSKQNKSLSNYYKKNSNYKHKGSNIESRAENYFEQDNFNYFENYNKTSKNRYVGNWRKDEKNAARKFKSPPHKPKQNGFFPLGFKCCGWTQPSFLVEIQLWAMPFFLGFMKLEMLLEVPENSKIKVSAAGQRERLIDMINHRALECLVCCEKIRNNDKVWSCLQCYHIIHLSCTVAWAKSSKVEENWRCPACQNVCAEVPTQYKCFCGKALDPKPDPTIIPHGCGEMCLKSGKNCEHKCTILCHPGPCPDCNIMISKPCGCGNTQQVVKCSTDLEIVCDAICNKTLNCGIHSCLEKCHIGSCPPCSNTIIQECYCQKTGRKVSCTAEYTGFTEFCCENPCQKMLSCGNHKCQRQCHSGPCSPCERDVDQINSCFCGKTSLTENRNSCLDIIPCCDKICGKTLHCGQPSSPHTCKAKCHEGKCPPCPLSTFVRCRCGHMDKEIACQKLKTKADDARCEKKCSKKRLCGKHKCNQRCCIEIEHICPLPCNHQLSCGLHRCGRTCHSGRCPPCLETSFEELYCECGASVLYPPVPCGTKPPACEKPCSRPRLCGHPPNHDCHTGPCPPCFVLSKQWCYGHHEQRAAIPCNQENFSCGLPCGKPMSCGRHKCVKPCHEGECPYPCIQPCIAPRFLCGHPCNKPCHDLPCPESNCRQMVPISCACGLQKSSKQCMELSEEFRNIEMAQLKEKMGDMSFDQAVDISDLVIKPKRPSVLKILECTDECRIIERNRRLAIGLQIRNPDLTQKLTPRYSDFLKQWAKRDPHFCQRVHNRLTELVQLAKQSKQKSRSYSFDSMNRDKRHFIHEYCEHFGVDSAAYDMEPNRNVVATAIKDKSWLPSMGLLEVIQRENGQRKVPGPVLSNSSTGKSATVSLKVLTRSQKPLTTEVGETLNLYETV